MTPEPTSTSTSAPGAGAGTDLLVHQLDHGSVPLLHASGIRKSFPVDDGSITVLHGVDLTIHEGELVAVMGPSGSGKSTLLHSVSGLDTVDEGSIVLGGTELTTLGPDALADARREQMGFVFQQPTLLKDLTLLDNIVLTSALDRVGTAAERVTRAQELMARAGIWELRDRMTSQVSGGQLQRAGICRALMRRPALVLADEPTGSLNSGSAAEIMDLLVELNADGTTMLLVTHDTHVAAHADRVLFMVDGLVADELVLAGSGTQAARVEAITGRMRQLGI